MIFFHHHISQYLPVSGLLACFPIAIEWDKCVASPCSDIDTGLLFIFRPTPSRLLFPICLLGLFPRPHGVGCASAYLICCCGRGGGLPACFLVPCRSLAPARSLLPPSSSCGACCLAVSSVSCRRRLSCVPASFDVVKTFQSMRFSI